MAWEDAFRDGGSVQDSWKADRVIAAHGDGTNDTNVIRYTATTTDKDALPTSWQGGGYYVRIQAVGVDIQYLFSTLSTQTVVDTAASAAGATAATLGEKVPAGTTVSRYVPRCAAGDTIYFARLGDTGGEVYLTRG